ncbi:hypothetical protein BDM02DRAFT_3132825 [Thelephora ganbajun]|uniref:Uncharacterized protein n=1 Tax=Thelephora ganbajun TaxID=370292 RepID=A0ACB6Z0B4_THEGA|nr:hypothetical protein BDM02DRAFT_3132825 [Thelephora ganbajun]
MVHYKLNFTVSSPGNSTVFVEFSPNGRFLAVGDRDLSSLYILDRLTGFHPTISATTPAEPTALVWETSKAFYVGLSDGCFTYYQIDLGGSRLVKGVTNSVFHGVFPVTAMALDTESKTLVLSVGPEVFAFQRIRMTSEFRFVANISSRFNFKSDPGTPAPPFPRSICFTPNNTLVIAFCRQNIASIVLEFDGDSRLRSSFQTAKIQRHSDYSGLPLLKAITSASEDEIQRLTRFWVYGSASQADSDTFPFLFINGGVATLSGSASGVAMVKDTITQREMQLLDHTVVADRPISALAYHISTDRYSIVTADCGTNATVKVWTARRSSNSRGQSRYAFLTQKGYVIAILVVVSAVIALGRMERLLNTDKISHFCFQIALAFAKLCIEIGYLILGVAEFVVLDFRVAGRSDRENHSRKTSKHPVVLPSCPIHFNHPFEACRTRRRPHTADGNDIRFSSMRFRASRTRIVVGDSPSTPTNAGQNRVVWVGLLGASLLFCYSDGLQPPPSITE